MGIRLSKRLVVNLSLRQREESKTDLINPEQSRIHCCTFTAAGARILLFCAVPEDTEESRDLGLLPLKTFPMFSGFYECFQNQILEMSVKF